MGRNPERESDLPIGPPAQASSYLSVTVSGDSYASSTMTGVAEWNPG